MASPQTAAVLLYALSASLRRVTVPFTPPVPSENSWATWIGIMFVDHPPQTLLLRLFEGSTIKRFCMQKQTGDSTCVVNHMRQVIYQLLEITKLPEEPPPANSARTTSDPASASHLQLRKCSPYTPSISAGFRQREWYIASGSSIARNLSISWVED